VEKVMGVLSEAVILTVAAQILTLPLMIGYFGQLSIISLLANALILPVQPAVMIWGGLATLVGLVVPAVGQLLAWVAWLFLGYTIWMVRLFAAVPGAAVPLTVSTAGVVAIFGVIAALTWWSKQSVEKRGADLDGRSAKHHPAIGSGSDGSNGRTRLQLGHDPTRRPAARRLFQRRAGGCHLHSDAQRAANFG
jgi:hypothetical protein